MHGHTLHLIAILSKVLSLLVKNTTTLHRSRKELLIILLKNGKWCFKTNEEDRNIGVTIRDGSNSKAHTILINEDRVQLKNVGVSVVDPWWRSYRESQPSTGEMVLNEEELRWMNRLPCKIKLPPSWLPKVVYIKGVMMIKIFNHTNLLKRIGICFELPWLRSVFYFWPVLFCKKCIDDVFQ